MWRSRDEWNDGLLEAVFAPREDVGPIYRIDATDSFLATASGLPAASARARFVGCFQGRPLDAKQLFDAERWLRSWTSDSNPAFFAQLYLTLIVASADEETYREGNFRRRLSQILGLPDEYDAVGSGLPVLWRALAVWSEKRSVTSGTVRRLILPDAGSEVIIGYSKRLAFPAFRDQTKLGRLLSQSSLTAEHPIADIVHAIGASVDDFSPEFQQEYQIFRTEYEVSHGDPFATPLWAAIEAVTWTDMGPSAQSQIPTIHLSIDWSESYLPQIEVIVPKSWDSTNWPCAVLPVATADCDRVIVSDGRVDPAASVLLGRDAPVLPVSPSLSRCIEQGVVCFGAGESLPWIDRACVPAHGRVVLGVSTESVRSTILDRLRVETGESPSIQPVPGIETWSLIGPLWADELVAAVRGSTLEGYQALRPSLERSEIRLTNATKLPDGILFLPPVLPHFSIPCADSAAIIKDQPGSKVELMRITREAQEFRLPSDWRAHVDVPGVLTISASKGEHEVRRRSFRTTSRVTDSVSRKPSDPSAWLVEDTLGQLTPLAPDETASRRRDMLGLSGRPISLSDSQPQRDVSTWERLESLPTKWSALLECLIGEFSIRQGLGMRRTIELVDASGLAISGWTLLESLSQNQFIERLYARRWRGTRVFPRPLRAWEQAPGELRLTGLLSASTRDRLIGESEKLGLAPEIAAAPSWHSVGAVRLRFPESKRRLATELVSTVTALTRPPPLPSLPSPAELTTSTGTRVNISDKPAETHYWDGVRFVDRTKETSWLERREFERHQPVYVLVEASEPRWATNCRGWALLVALMSIPDSRATLEPDGRLRLPTEGPDVLAKAAVTHGRGVVAPSRMERGYCWTYSFDSLSQGLSVVSHWARRGSRDESKALVRWRRALERRRREHYLAMPNQFRVY